MRITKASSKDATPISALTMRSKAHWGYSNEQMEEWREELTITADYIQENAVYQLLDKEALIGFYAFAPMNDSLVKLNFFFLDPSFIRQGYGKKLLVDFLERAKKMGYKKVTLDADPYAEAFYAKQGFQVVGQLASSIKDRFLPIMELEINAYF